MASIVVKIGSSSLMTLDQGLDQAVIKQLVQSITTSQNQGHQVALVSSGAVALGASQLQLQKPYLPYRKNILAALGQNTLMQHYQKLFAQHNRSVAQLLLVRQDLQDRQMYLTARSTLLGLLDHQITPIINENDVVAAASFGGNDLLAAAIAGLMNADYLVAFTDVPGVYDHWPIAGNDQPLTQISEQQLQTLIDQQTAQNESKQAGIGTGGILTKLQAAQLAQSFGTTTIITQFSKKTNLTQLIQDESNNGTRIPATLSPLEARKRWLRYGIAPQGEIIIDPGAVQALVHQSKSLLPVGAVSLTGHWQCGDAVTIKSQKNGQAIGQGLCQFSSEQTQKILGFPGNQITTILPQASSHELVHRDDLVIF